MSRKLLALVAVAGLALAGYAGAAGHGMLPEGADMGLGAKTRCQRADAAAQGEPLQRCDAARERHGRARAGHRPPHLPAFTAENGTVDGKWVRFQVDAASASILGYTSKGPFAAAVVFDRVTLGAGSDDDAMRTRGPLWVGREGQVAALAFNAPNALLAVRNFGDDPVTVTFDLGEEVVAERAERGIALTREGHGAVLVPKGNATASVAGDVVTVTLGKGDAVVFHVEGYPRLLKLEAMAVRHLGERWEDRRADRQERPPPEPGQADASAELEATLEA